MTHPRLAGLGTLLGRQAGARGFRSRMPFLFVCVCLVLLAGCASSGIDKDALVPVSDVLAAERAVVASGGASYDYVIARRDQLNITVYLRSGVIPVIALTQVPVNLRGNITFPFVGQLRAEGLTVDELHVALEDLLDDYYLSPVISLEIASAAGQKVFVLGEVPNPGIYFADGSTTIVEVILEAGGFSRDADLENILLLRSALRGDAGPVLTTLNLRMAVESANLSDDIVLRPDDLVVVPPRGIARLGRTMGHYFAIASPFFGLMETVVTLLILTSVVQ